MNFRNVYQLFREQTERYGPEPVFHTRAGDGWSSTTWRQFEDDVHAAACGLRALGLEAGDGVSILAGNAPEWPVMDLAAIAAGGVGVGIYPTSSPEQCEYIIGHSESGIVFVDTHLQFKKIKALPMPNVRAVIVGSGGEDLAEGTDDGTRVLGYRSLLELGEENRTRLLADIEKGAMEKGLEDIAIMVYTSGTTGVPKGVMLSHRYILNSCESLRRSVPIFHDDVCFSYLPFCHVAERISGLYNRLYNGTAAYFVDDLSRLYEYMLEVRPTVFASLPRFFEKIYAKVISEHGADASPEDVVAAFGGRARLLTSGGAPLPLDVAELFARSGIPILQAYGLTENICVAFNRADDNKFGTVGKPMPMCEVRIADDGEILVNSEMMFSGYFKDPAATREMFDEEGWLKTGDLGSLDEDGFLSVTGRKKEIIVLSSGKNVAPALVENLIKQNHMVSNVFLHGDERNYCVALITLNIAEAEAFCAARGIEARGYRAVMNEPAVIESVAETVANANSKVSSSEQIKRYAILARDLSQEEGELTPTMKLKRDVVGKNFKAELDALYED